MQGPLHVSGVRTYTDQDLRRGRQGGHPGTVVAQQPAVAVPAARRRHRDPRRPGRRLDIADRSGWAARLVCGAAAYNARLALAVAGRPALVRLCPDPGDRDLVARLTPGPERPSTYPERDLHAAVARRYSNRAPFWPDPVPASAGGPVAEPQDLLPQRSFADRRRTPGRDYEPEPLIGILGVPGDRPTDQVVAGQALQRVLLTAADAGLCTSMISQPIEVPAPATSYATRSADPATRSSRSASDTAAPATPPLAATWPRSCRVSSAAAALPSCPLLHLTVDSCSDK